MPSAHAELLKAPYKAPSVRAHHRGFLEPQNPLTAPKWLLLLFCALHSASYKWPHSTPGTALDSPMNSPLSWCEKKKKVYVSDRGAFGGHSVSSFTLGMSCLNGFRLYGSFWMSKRVLRKIKVGVEPAVAEHVKIPSINKFGLFKNWKSCKISTSQPHCCRVARLLRFCVQSARASGSASDNSLRACLAGFLVINIERV